MGSVDLGIGQQCTRFLWGAFSSRSIKRITNDEQLKQNVDLTIQNRRNVFSPIIIYMELQPSFNG
jgi:hypothetical protein